MTQTDFPSWPDVAADLIATATGRQPADMVLKGGRWVNVHTRQILPEHDIAITKGRIACVVPDADYCIGPETDVIDVEGRFMVPGLCDAHMHIECGMLTPAEFARAVIPHGTTSMFTDPHEIANVLGLDGVRMMHDEALMQPINIFTQMPSCAPSAPGLETTGFEITAEDVAEAMAWPGIIGLGEMMNFPGVSSCGSQDAGRNRRHADGRKDRRRALCVTRSWARVSLPMSPAVLPTITKAPRGGCDRAGAAGHAVDDAAWLCVV